MHGYDPPVPAIDRILRSNIKLRHLQLLVALDQFRHLGRTAEFMAVSQPAVSRMLGEIEGMLELVLFERSSRGTEPTEAGASLVRFARSVLADYERTRDEIAAVESGALGRTRVGSMVVSMPVLLAEAVARLKQVSPQATVLVEEGDLTRLLPKLRLGEIDLFVGRLEPGYAAPDLETQALFNEPMVAVVAPGHPLSSKARPAWADLARLPCVLPPPWASLRVKLEQLFYRHGLEVPTDVIETASFLGIATFVRQRQAVAFVAQSVGRECERAGLMQVLAMDVPVELPPVGLITLRGRPPTRITERLMAQLREVAAERDKPARPATERGAARPRTRPVR